ncbi:MAG: uridine kinase [Candidatus Glassbacteria bacterium]
MEPTRAGETGPKSKQRAHIQSRFTRESLIDKGIIDSTEIPNQYRVMPDLNVIAIGGKSILDRGASAILPLVEELAANRYRHQLLLCTGPGICGRQTLCLAQDLGLPTGGQAMLTGGDESKYLFMLFGLLAPHGGVWMAKLVHFERLPLYVKNHMIPITLGQAPYFFWEKPSKYGSIPEHGNDFGSYITGEVLGVRSVIYLKDVEGLYTADPKRNPGARFIKKISAQELMELDLDELVIERSAIENLARGRVVRKIQIINGLVPGNLTRALDGEEVGTIIYRETGKKGDGH